MEQAALHIFGTLESSRTRNYLPFSPPPYLKNNFRFSSFSGICTGYLPDKQARHNSSAGIFIAFTRLFKLKYPKESTSRYFLIPSIERFAAISSAFVGVSIP